jgi:hypothetical protein
VPRRYRWITACIFAVAWIALASAGRGEAAEPRIADIIVTRGSDDMVVYASLRDAFTGEIEESIVNGVPTTFTYTVRLMRRRGLLPDAQVTSFTVRQGVTYDLLRDEFLLVRETNGRRETRVTKLYADVRRWMGELAGMRVASYRVLQPDELYAVQIKAEIRSVKLAFPLNLVPFVGAFFNFDTPWATSAYFAVGR